MGKDRSRVGMRKGKRKKGSFLDNQKKHRAEVKKSRNAKIVKKTEGDEGEVDSGPRKAFKFQNFSEQVAAVDSSIVYQLAGIGKISVQEDSSSCVFSQTLEHWRDLNLTTRFCATDKKLAGYVSLPLVVVGKEDIVGILCDHLQEAGPLDIQPVLELVAALATDLQHELYPNLPRILEVLMSKALVQRDALVIQWSLRCLGHLLRILWRPLSKDLASIYKQLSALFSKSRPDFIRYLGAETVAFLLRKTKEKEELLELILDFDDGTDPQAIAKLLFEAVKAVNGQFNTHVKVLWPLYLEKLEVKHAEKEVLLKIFQFCAEHSDKEYLAPLIQQSVERLNVINPFCKSSSDYGPVNYLLRCLRLVLLIGSGRLVQQPDLFVNILESTEAGSQEVVDLLIALVSAEKLAYPREKVEEVLSKLVSTSSNLPLERKLSLVEHFVAHPLFSSCLLRPFICLVQKDVEQGKMECLDHLAKLLRQLSSAPTLGSQLLGWKPHILDLNLVKEVRSLPKDKVFTSLVLEKISASSTLQEVQDALTCAASLRPLPKAEVLSRISTLVEKTESTSSLLPMAIATATLFGGGEVFPSVIKEETVLNAFLAAPNSRAGLQSLDFLLSHVNAVECEALNKESSEKLVTLLVEGLARPESELRLLALSCLNSLLPSLLGEEEANWVPREESGYQSILSITGTLLQVEQLSDSLTSYKDKLNMLERVEFSRIEEVLNRAGPVLRLMPLRYMLGLLYTNFTLLWAPLSTLLATYGQGLARDEFWEVWCGQLKIASEHVASQLSSLGEEKEEVTRVDYISYRNHLWEAMSSFSHVAEAKNRDLVPLFLDSFIKGEYVAIRQLSEEKKEEKTIVQTTVKSLLAHLGTFAKFQDLKSMHRRAELQQFCYNLLCHKLPAVQKVALEVLVAFKLKFLLPYKENLLRLLEEKDFKQELLAFPLGQEDASIAEEHRQELMPVILRLLYGRMRAKKAGKKGGGRAVVVARRGLVLHHLMALPEQELKIFLDLVFNDLFEEGQKDIDLFQYILEQKEVPERSSGQMQACTELVQAIMGKLGGLLTPSTLSYLLSMICWLGSLTQAAIDKENTSPLRSLRNTVYATLATFYTKFDSYHLEEKEQKAVSKVFLWRILPVFETDFIHSSSGLLHLLLAWSKDSKRKELFQLAHPESNVGVLQTICKVLNKATTNVKVIDSVLDIIHNLVKEDDDDEAMAEDHKSKGVSIVLTEMEVILAHFGAWIQATNANLKSLRRVGVKLDILSSLAPYVTDSSTALELFKQLIVLSGSLKKSESVTKVLVISKHLMMHVATEKVNDVVADLVPFFGKMTNRLERKELGLILENAATLEPSLGFVAEICIELNAFDRKKVEEPDFERRMEVFKKVRGLVKEGGEISDLELQAVIFNCCHTLKHDSDSSLKSNALEALSNVSLLLQGLAEKRPDVARSLVEKTCLNQIRTGIKHKEDSVRCDFISFLQSLVKNCGEASGRVKELGKLSCSEDSDLDFWENLRHVQLHRRGRAMARLAKRLNEEPGLLKVKSLQQIVLPLTTVYLLNDNFSKNSQLVEQAIELVGAVNKALPWAQYDHNIKYYLELFSKEIAHQRQLVKIITAILDNFHFDLSKDEEAPKNDLEDGQAEVEDVEMEEEKVEKEDSKEEVLRQKIFHTVQNVLLPKLHATLAGKTKGPTNISDEDKLILRVPLALPIIKMLGILSPRLQHKAVPGILAKVASFLKSKAVEIRTAARATLCAVMEQLGSRYVALMLKELQSQLTRGYQLHVLTFTFHSVLHKLAEVGKLNPGDLDRCCGSVVEVCLDEMFGAIAEEKDVAKITGKLMEARGTKSYDTLQLLSRFVSNNCLMDLVRPIADKCATFSTFKNLTKVRESFRNVVLGLLANSKLDSLHALTFIYGVITDKIRLGKAGEKEKNDIKDKENLKEKESIFIVQRAPKRQGELVAKTSKSASQHVIHEFGLNLLNFLLKRSSLVGTDPEHCSRLEPFLPLFMDFLSSSHVTIVTATLRCLLWILKFPLNALDRTKVLEFTNKVFDLLNKFGAGTDGRGENHDLVVIASKLLVVLIRDVELTCLDQNHLKTVLDYVVTDVMDPFKATTAFGLLSAIVSRKLKSPELHDVMLKMVELSVQSDNAQTRTTARSVVTSYVANYSLKKKLGKLVDMYAGQLTYEVVSGRVAAAESLKVLMTTVGKERVEQHAEFLFFSLAPRLLNDDSPEAKKAVASTLGTLFKTTSQGKLDKMVSASVTWFKSTTEPAHCQLAAHLLALVLDHLQLTPLRSHLSTLLEHLPRHLESPEDHLVLQALHLNLRLVGHLEAADPKLTSTWRAVHATLLHSHAWARLRASQLVGVFLAQVPPEKMLDTVKAGKDHWLGNVEVVKSLILDLLEQLGLHLEEGSELGEQVIKNLVALAKLLLLPGWREMSQDVTFNWLVKKVVKVANQELVSTPKITVKRTLTFSWVAAACLEASADDVESVLGFVLPPLHREVGKDSDLKSYCQEVLDLLKTKVDPELFDSKYIEVQRTLAKKKGERAAQKKQNLVLNPKLAAKRKIQQNEAKKKAKKAKIKAL